MRIYTIYSDRIEISSDYITDVTLEFKLNALSADLLNFYYSLPLGKGITYRRMSYIIDDLVHLIDFNKPVDEASLVSLLRNSICFTRRNFPDFQIHILNHV